MLAVYQSRFLQTALAVKALKFGEFTLKSGRVSPYFFNAGAFADGKALAVMADAYAELIVAMRENGQEIDVLFGPAYKGIPLVAAIATTLYHSHGINLPWAFNRKEAKTHGEGGTLVGSEVHGKRVLIVDDVLTAGTAVRQSLKLLTAAGAQPVGLIVALDRQERVGDNPRSALMQLREDTGIATEAVVTLDDLLAFAGENAELNTMLEALQGYRARYGVCSGAV